MRATAVVPPHVGRYALLNWRRRDDAEQGLGCMAGRLRRRLGDDVRTNRAQVQPAGKGDAGAAPLADTRLAAAAQSRYSA